MIQMVCVGMCTCVSLELYTFSRAMCYVVVAGRLDGWRQEGPQHTNTWMDGRMDGCVLRVFSSSLLVSDL